MRAASALHTEVPAATEYAASIAASGNLELHPRGYGFLRDPANNYKPSVRDALVPAALVQGFELRQGAFVRGLARDLQSDKSPLVHELHEVEGLPAGEYRSTPQFESLTPIHPFEEEGSLTIPATALVETGSRMDDLIFEEFKGTGNLDLVLDRRLAERRIWPAIDLTKSGTRRDEKLLDLQTLQAVTYRRRTWNPRDPAEAMQDLTAQLAKHRSNRAFVDLVNRQAALAGEY